MFEYDIREHTSGGGRDYSYMVTVCDMVRGVPGLPERRPASDTHQRSGVSSSNCYPLLRFVI